MNDDCAVIDISGENYLFSLDTLVENTHFTNEVKAYDIGWRAATANISDICSMGGQPLFFLVGLSLPSNISEQWIEELYKGMLDCSKKYGGAKLIGGDLTRSEQKTISISIVGKANSKGVLMRSGAKPGYKLCVTGSFGTDKPYAESFLERFPRYFEAQKIWESCSEGALIDSSDGLAQSMIEIAEKSGVKISYDAHKIPREISISVQDALFGGEEFELVGCFAEPPEGFIEIGIIEKGSGVYELSSGTRLTKNKGFQHFED